MPIERHFLDFAAPVLPQAAAFMLDHLADRMDASVADLRHWIAVLPARRAGRRLRQLLLEGTEDRHARLVPPRICTLGGLVEETLEFTGTPAGNLARQQAWAHALRSNLDDLSPVLPHPPAHGDHAAWMALAAQFDTLHAELAGDDLTFADVAHRGEQLSSFTDGQRWRLMEKVRVAYTERLAEAGLIDPHEARRRAIQAGRVRNDRRVVFIVVTDLNAIQRRLISLLANPVTLIHAARDRADAFDDLGAIKPSAWEGVHIPLDDRQIDIAGTPAEQAGAAVQTIAAFDGRYAADQITIGVCDDELCPYLEQHLDTAALPNRSATGLAIARTRPVRLLSAAADFLAQRDFREFAALLRHPDVESRSGGESESVEDWLTLLDRYYNDTLHCRLTGTWLGDHDRQHKLKSLHDRVLFLMGDLTAPPPPAGPMGPTHRPDALQRLRRLNPPPRPGERPPPHRGLFDHPRCTVGPPRIAQRPLHRDHGRRGPPSHRPRAALRNAHRR